MPRYQVPYAAALALGAGLLAGCLQTPSAPPGPAEPSAARAAAAGTWEPIDWPAHVPAFTAYAGITGWALDRLNPVGSDYRVKRWNNGVSALVSGAFTDIDIIGNTQLWARNGAGSVYRNASPYSAGGGTWTLLCGGCGATGIAAGSNGDVYYTSQPGPGNWTIHKYKPSSNTWTNLYYPLVTADVDNNGDLYGLDPWGDGLVRLKSAPGSGWELLRFPAWFTGAGLAVGGGRVYLLNRQEPLAGFGFRVYTWSAGALSQTNIWAEVLQADAAGRGWATNGDNRLFRYIP